MSRKPNYKLKAAILNSDDMCKVVQDFDFLSSDTPFLEFVDKEYKYAELCSKVGMRFVNEARKINLAAWKRKIRLKERIGSYLKEGQCIWLTLTFSPSVLDSTSVDTRRKYVQRQLKSVSNKYVANIDFGKSSQREHYHAVVVGNLRRSDFQEWIDNYGHIWIEDVHKTSSEEKLAKYISKLTNHAIKETTKRQCYIYSRCR